MDTVDKLRAKGLHEIASEFMRMRNDLIVARRSLLVSHQINEEYRVKLEKIDSIDGRFDAGSETHEKDTLIEARGLIEKNVVLARENEEVKVQLAQLQDKLENAVRSLNLAMRTSQEESSARMALDARVAKLIDENASLAARLAQFEENEASYCAPVDTMASTESQDSGINLADQLAALEKHHASVLRELEDALNEKRALEEKLLQAESAGHDEENQSASESGASAFIELLEKRIEEQRLKLETLEAVRSENDLIKRQFDEIQARNAVLELEMAQAGNSSDEAESLKVMLEQLKGERSDCVTELELSRATIHTLNADIENARQETQRAIEDMRLLREKNIALMEQIRTLEQAHPVGDDLPCSPEAEARQMPPHDVMLSERSQASLAVVRRILEQTVFNHRQPDAMQVENLKMHLAGDGSLALAHLLELERGRLTRRILAALSADDEHAG